MDSETHDVEPSEDTNPLLQAAAKRRGRPPKARPGDQEAREVVTSANPPQQAAKPTVVRGRPNDELARRRAARKARGVTDYGFVRKLAVDERRLDLDNYVYRFVNADQPGWVGQLQNQEWEPVTSEEIGGQEVLKVGGLNGEGKAAQQLLMKKYKPWYDEDQAEQANLRREQENALMRGKGKDIQADYAPETNYVSAADMRVPKGPRSGPGL